MTNKKTLIVAILGLVIAVVALFYAPVTLRRSNGLTPVGATSGMLAENYIPYVLLNSGYKSAKDITTTGVLTSATLAVTSTSAFTGVATFSASPIVTTTATTSLSLLSTSSTKGVCIPFNATSTNTALNLTFAASTTAVSTAGVTPVISYGACN